MNGFWRSYLKFFGWNTTLTFPYHHLKKYVIIVGPHTSNWDFIIGLAYRSLLGLTASKFLGKKELFKPPFGSLFRKLGGIPVNRESKNNMVEDVARLFQENEEFILALSPEGTRSKVEKLKTGFYFIARQANVPIVMVGLDWKNKTAIIGAPFVPQDKDADFETIHTFYRTIEGRHPEKGMM
jgi:1-acyl-sn-glycerol-3-phosphate acyltransferase